MPAPDPSLLPTWCYGGSVNAGARQTVQPSCCPSPGDSIISTRPTSSALLCAALSVAACTTTSPDVVQRDEAQRLSKVQDAVVLSSRPVVVDGTQSGAGGAAGAVVGGI